MNQAFKSPRRFRDTGQLALVRHLPQTDPTQAEFAVDRLRPPAFLASGIGPYAELGLARLLHSERCFGHGLLLLSSPGTGSRGDAAAPGPPRRWSRW